MGAKYYQEQVRKLREKQGWNPWENNDIEAGLLEALSFYANKGNWKPISYQRCSPIDDDYGKIARAAIAAVNRSQKEFPE